MAYHVANLPLPAPLPALFPHSSHSTFSSPSSLRDLAARAVASSISALPANLRVLPPELAHLVFSFLPLPLEFPALDAFARTGFWQPESLSLASLHLPQYPASFPARFPLERLAAFASSLRRVNLSGCRWLRDLEPLSVLPRLSCLGIAGCTSLHQSALSMLCYLPSLTCLDLSRNPQVNDGTATAVIPWIPSLRHLDLSHTAVTSAFLDSLTYGARLKGWRNDAEKSSRKAEARKAAKRPWWGAVTDTYQSEDAPATGCLTKRPRPNHEQHQQLQLPQERQPMSQEHQQQQQQQNLEGQQVEEQSEWPECHLIHLRLQGTAVDRAGASHLLGLSATAPRGGIFCLDLRDTSVKGDVLTKLRSTFHLLSPPNQPRLLCRTNALALNILRTYPGPAPESSHRTSSFDDRPLSGGWDTNERGGERGRGGGRSARGGGRVESWGSGSEGGGEGASASAAPAAAPAAAAASPREVHEWMCGCQLTGANTPAGKQTGTCSSKSGSNSSGSICRSGSRSKGSVLVGRPMERSNVAAPGWQESWMHDGVMSFLCAPPSPPPPLRAPPLAPLPPPLASRTPPSLLHPAPWYYPHPSLPPFH
ncbi:hypothetical protein CLOM_g505 [Closterium sp. NIES-68]|nr:hypothetical protein CLOM_g505 [Closterium sp. NIES-68]GJP69207.1 hypothetical protein CLOP_g157 [Closterium sp. NIES-67]